MGNFARTNRCDTKDRLGATMTTTRVAHAPGAPEVVELLGSTYRAEDGAVQDVPDFHATLLGAAGWTVIAASGPTSERPKRGSPSPMYFDTTLNRMIVWQTFRPTPRPRADRSIAGRFVFPAYEGRWIDPSTGGPV